MLEFEWPIGNRGPEAKLRQARLQQAQAIAAHRAAIEGVIFEVKSAIRRLQRAYEQIGVRLEAVLAEEDDVRAIQARQERRDPPSLELEISAHERLGQRRRELLDAIIADYQTSSFAGYNIRLVELEKLKGTLLEYYNIVVTGADDESYPKPYRPIGQ